VQASMRASLQRNLDAMLEVARAKRAEGATHLEFMLHSSELMPGGSPTFRNESDIDRLYDSLERLFEEVSAWCRGMTLQETHARLERSPAPTAQSDAVDGPSDRPPPGVRIALAREHVQIERSA
jgi:hypothetical protein